MPWHRYGTRLMESATAKEALDAAGLSWKLIKRVNTSQQNRGTRSRHVIVREDLGSQHDSSYIVGSIKEDYLPLQNVDAFSLFDPIVQAGIASYDAAGLFDGGKLVWMVLRFQGNIELLPNDLIARFLFFGTSLTTGQYRMAYLPGRLVCRNTLNEDAFHNPPPLVTTPDIRPRQFEIPVKLATREMETHFEKLVKRFRAMADVKLTGEQVEEYLTKVFDHWEHTKRKSERIIEKDENARKMCVRLFEHGVGNDLPHAQGTLWAAYSALTEYVDYRKSIVDDSLYLQHVFFSSLKAGALHIATQMS